MKYSYPQKRTTDIYQHEDDSGQQIGALSEKSGSLMDLYKVLSYFVFLNFAMCFTFPLLFYSLNLSFSHLKTKYYFPIGLLLANLLQ